jgi:beta-glucanase (GH16 family)
MNRVLPAAAIALSLTWSATADDAPAMAPKFLCDPASPTVAAQLAADGGDVTVTPENGGLSVLVRGGPQGYPGFGITPAEGKVWDLSPWGHVEAKITNTGAKNLSVNLRVDNEGPWQQNPWNCESVSLKPGETKIAKVIFGYQYGYKPGYKLKPEAVTRLLFFLGKSAEDRTFRVEDVQAGGPAGEKPAVDPNSVVVRPAGGVILGKDVALDAAKQLAAKGDAKAALTADRTLRIDVAAAKNGAATVKPAMGSWDLGMYDAVRVTLRNVGATEAAHRVRLESRGGSGDTVAVPALAPGAEATVTVPFAAAKPWVGVPNPKPGHGGGLEGTGTRFESNRANGVTVLADATAGAANVEVTAVVAVATPIVPPEWLGKRPPVEGDWTLTFDDSFDGEAIDLQRWNIYTDNFWDKRTHFAKDNTIVKDGTLILRYEKKTGFHNDDPNAKGGVGKTDFACGFADTYGKWTQRYGYFEARMKLPTCPGLWPAFWMMPDRGAEQGEQWKRASTSNGGMEFDIMEHLTAWGPRRFNLALHWDGYQKEHKAIGTSNAYVPADAEGYLTISLLWTPGSAVFYGNGQEIGRWENERISSIPSYPILYMVSGGWANVPLDEAQLPADFVVDYVRAWQRKDLASAADGPKPNDGRPKSQ